MNIQYPVSEILRCVDYINDPEKEIYENTDKVLVLNNPLTMIKKTKETKELESASAEPFQIEEIIKVDNSNVNKKKSEEDVLVLSEEVPDKYLSEKKDSENQDKKEIKKLDEQVSVLKTHNAMLQRDLNDIFKTINHKSSEKELQSRLELVYEQQRVIKDYENQILNLKNENEFLEKKFDSLPNKIISDLKHDDKSKIDPKKAPQLLSQEKYNEELEIKSKIIHEQQGALNDYQNQILKLKDENQLLNKNIEINNSKLIAATQIQRENNDNDSEIQNMAGKIKHYQEDNLRLSNEVVKLSSKLDNTKQQLKQFENNKFRLMSQLENLNKIISENNVIGSPFDAVKPKISKIDEKPSLDEKISDEEQTVLDTSEKKISLKSPEELKEINDKAKKIFGS